MASQPTGPEGNRLLELPPGRTLAYTTCGAPASTSRLLLAFHGALGVGDFSTFDSVFKNEGYHVVSPTLPGWGASSDASTEIWVTDYFQDILVLIRELENQMNKKIGSLNLMGVSYGSLAALHLAVNLEKNGGPKVGKCLVMSGFVPFRMPGLDYSIGMTFQQRLTMGTFAKWNPWFARFTASVVGRYLTTIEDAVKFATDNISKTMNATETEQLEAIRKRNPKDPRCDPSAIGRNMFFSLRMSKKGYTTIPQNLWDEQLWSIGPLESFPCPLYVTGATGDSFAPINLQRFLASSTPKGRTVFAEHAGGHMSYSLLFEESFPAFAQWDGNSNTLE